MSEFYDENGERVEGILPPDQAEELQNKVKELEEKAGKIEEYESELNEKRERLKQYESKDFNFSNLRNKSEKEKDELLKDFSEKEKKLVLKIDELEQKIDEGQKQTLKSYEKDVLGALAGDSEELQNKIKEVSKEFIGEAKTKEEMLSRYKRAYAIVKSDVKDPDPINQFYPVTGSSPLSSKKKSYTDTDQGKQNFQSWFGIDINK